MAEIMLMIFNDKCMQVNTEAENAMLVGMAEEALLINHNNGIDYWMGGVRTADGWKWMSGAPMDYTDWHGDPAKGGDYMTLLKNNYPAFQWATETEQLKNEDNGVICEMKAA